MRILLLTNSLLGLHTIRMEVIKAIKDKGHDVIISGPSHEIQRVFEDSGCKMVDTKLDRKSMNPLKDIELILHYRKLIRKTNPDVVLTYTIKPNLYGGMACQMCHVPQIANVTGLGSAVENPGWLQRLTILLYKIGLRNAHTIFFQNKANMEFCQKHKMVKGNLKLLPGSGVNLQYHAFQSYPAEDEPIRFIFVSRLLREKGIEEYLTAAKEVRCKHPNVEFHILGTCEEDYKGILDELQKDGTVIYHGRQSDVRPFIGKAWCMVHPSFYPEGMSNVLLESCAAGRPVITTDRPGCGEIVEVGVNGFLVKQRDGLDVAKKVEQFMALPYEKKLEMGQAARRKVEQEFDRQIVVNAYLKEIDSLD
jgi:galacturonosyltransferase